MRILVVNDDGVQEPGLWALADALDRLGDVRVYSPSRNYSGAGMSVSLTNEFHLCRAGPPESVDTQVSGFTVDATPATVAAIGCAFAFDDEPNVIVSGINPGWNTGMQTYVSSGTAGAARVAVDRGFLGVAVSHAPNSQENIVAIAAGAARLVEAAYACGVLGLPVLININTPTGFEPETPARLTHPARFTLFEGVNCDGESLSTGEQTTVRLTYGNIFDGPALHNDETEALRQGSVSVCVTDPFKAETLLEDPWPEIAAAFSLAD